MDSLLGFGTEVPGLISSSGKDIATLLEVLNCNVTKKRSNHKATFSMGHAGAIRKIPNDIPEHTETKYSVVQFLDNSWQLFCLADAKIVIA